MVQDQESNSLCRHCATPLQGSYCHQCGQETTNPLRSLPAVLGQFFGDFSNWDGRIWRTLSPLWFKPGYLSRRFVDGHRACYVPPWRLYLFTSILAFLMFSVSLAGQVERTRGELRPPAPPQAQMRSQGDLGEEPLPSAQFDLSHVPGVSPELSERLSQKFEVLAANPNLAIDRFFSLAPQMMFLLLPVLAGFLKLFYLGQGLYFLEHLVLVLYVQSFFMQYFLLYLGLLKLNAWLQPYGLPGVVLEPLEMLYWWSIPFYWLLSLKGFYRQSWGWTSIKFLLTASLFGLMFGILFILTLIQSILQA